MPALQLTPAERKDKRGLAHHLDPVVMIGADGLTPAVEREVDAALRSHGLIKVRMLGDDRAVREAALQALADALDAAPPTAGQYETELRIHPAHALLSHPLEMGLLKRL